MRVLPPCRTSVSGHAGRGASASADACRRRNRCRRCSTRRARSRLGSRSGRCWGRGSPRRRAARGRPAGGLFRLRELSGRPHSASAAVPARSPTLSRRGSGAAGPGGRDCPPECTPATDANAGFPRASANSLAVANRSAGSFSSALARSSATFAGTAFRCSVTGPASAVTIFMRSPAACSPCGGSPGQHLVEHAAQRVDVRAGAASPCRPSPAPGSCSAGCRGTVPSRSSGPAPPRSAASAMPSPASPACRPASGCSPA